MKHVEHLHQKALIEWAYRTRIPAASDVKPGSMVGDYLFAIPNGGKRAKVTRTGKGGKTVTYSPEAARLKAEGVKPGVSDLMLPLRRKGCAGLWLEMKAPGERPTDLQLAWIDRMEQAGYLATWRDDWLEAAGVICRYLGIPEPFHRIRARQQEEAECNAS